MPPTTTNNATGLFLRKIFPSTSTASAAPPTASEAGLVSPRCLRKLPLFSQKLPCAPWMPNNLGNCVLARNSATPHLKPIITLSEMKLTIDPALHQPGDEGDERHQQRRARGQRAKPGRCRRSRSRPATRRSAAKWPR